VQLFVNGAAVVPVVIKAGIVTSISFQPADPLPVRSTINIELIFSDGTSLITNQ